MVQKITEISKARCQTLKWSDEIDTSWIYFFKMGVNALKVSCIINDLVLQVRVTCSLIENNEMFYFVNKEEAFTFSV